MYRAGRKNASERLRMRLIAFKIDIEVVERQKMVSVREFNPMPPELGEERQSQTHSKTNG